MIYWVKFKTGYIQPHTKLRRGIAKKFSDKEYLILDLDSFQVHEVHKDDITSFATVYFPHGFDNE